MHNVGEKSPLKVYHSYECVKIPPLVPTYKRTTLLQESIFLQKLQYPSSNVMRTKSLL